MRDFYPMGQADISGKKTINIYSQAWAEWVLRQQQIKVEAELSGEFQFIARSSDSLLRVRGTEGTYLVLTELQSRYDPKMPERLTIYKMLAKQKYEQDVFITVVYFLPPPSNTTLQTAYHDKFMGQKVYCDFQVIKLWELEARQILEFGNPALLPFVPLMHGGDNPAMVKQCAHRIRQEPDAAELEAVLAVFAGHVLDIETIKQLLRWEMHIIQESPIIQELREEWIQEAHERGVKEGHEQGIKEGLEKGQRQVASKMLHTILQTVFPGSRPERYQPFFDKLSLDDLEQLSEVALKAETLADFESALETLLREK